MNARLIRSVSLSIACFVSSQAIAETLEIPALSDGAPAAGKRVAVTPPEYKGTQVFHTLYLPANWKRSGERLPIIFEYTGNYFPKTGSTGRPEDAALGYGLSGGKYIWVSLPYVNEQGTGNAVTWWGDEEATVQYAKQNVSRIIQQTNADPNSVFLCGFSRGAIGVNYIGLHDDEIAALWTAFIAHDHFDGVKSWNTDWGTPFEKYQAAARKRLARVGNRPYWVSQNGKNHATETFVRSATQDPRSFTFGYVNTRDILGKFPNDIAKAAHTDRWPLVPSEYRGRIKNWMDRVVGSTRDHAAVLNFESMVQPVPSTSKFIDDDYYIWGGSMVRAADGTCHLLYSRWPRKLGHNAWVTHSEIARAVSNDPLGPYRHVDIALPARGKAFWDGMCTHNPTVHEFDGKYYLYYMGNFGDGNATAKLNPIHRNHQRIGVAVADHPAGPWTRFDKPLIDVTPTASAHDELMTSNPSILRRADGKYVLIYKAVGTKGRPPMGGPVVHLAAMSSSPLGPFDKQMKPLFTAPGVRFPAEDPYIWSDGKRCWAIVNDHKGLFNGSGEDSLALFTSMDGLNWNVADHPQVLDRKITWSDGTSQAFHRLERPQLWLENGVPKVLFCAAEETKEKTHSYNVHIPLIQTSDP
ncbi:MAG: glycoside hydrolase family protein [Rubripirellula sp.]